MHLIPRPKNVVNYEGEFFIERDTEIILSSELSFEDLNLAIMIQEEKIGRASCRERVFRSV